MGALSIRIVSIEFARERDGDRYPNPVNERFQLERNGTLKYFAYFGSMPMDCNHCDSTAWKSGALGTQVLSVALALAVDKTAGIEGLPDEAPSPGPRVFIVGVTADHSDSTRVIRDPATPAYQRLLEAFNPMIAAFEESTGRPLKPDQLPQGR